MERLQAAIEKARAQRDATIAAEQAATPRTEAAPKDDGTSAAATPTPQDAAWAALTPIKLKKWSMQRQRILTFYGGELSGAFDLLRTRMLQQAKQKGWSRIALVSPHAGCGKTTTAANLAFSLARQEDTHTMVFDFDLRRHGLTNILRQKPKQGMVDVLEGRLPFAEHGLRHGTNVAFGLNHGAVKTASEVLQSTKTKEVLSEIQGMYAPDLMLFDLPPLLASDDNFGFLNQVDAALILVTAEKTSMSQIDLAERHVAELTNVMGIVLNQCRYASGTYGHDYDYY